MKQMRSNPRILRRIGLILTLVMLFGITSCDNGDNVPSAETTQPDTTVTEPVTTEAEKVFPIADYVIVRPDTCESYESAIARALQTVYRTQLDASLEIVTDFEKLFAPAECELVLGKTTREGNHYPAIEAPAAGAYSLDAIDARLVARYSDVFGAMLAGEAMLRQTVPSAKQDTAVTEYYNLLEEIKIMGTMITLKNMYADGMLFQQNKPIRLLGSAEAGYTYQVDLMAGDEVVRSTTVSVGEDGAFCAELEGIAGSHTAHTIRISLDNGYLVDKLEDILIGELWLATGQSNMAYRLRQDSAYPDSFSPDAEIRVMMVSAPSGTYSAEPVLDHSSIQWYRGDSSANMPLVSAVGYYFCKTLRAELDVPVGIIQYAVGGAPIRAWMNPDNVAELRKNETLKSKYTLSSDWKPEEFRQPGAMYNTLAAPVEGLEIASVIWYQGEQDLGERNTLYTTEMEQLYRQYSAAYGFAEDEMPFIMPIIVPYLVNSNPQFYAQMTTTLSEYAQEKKMMVALPINDVTPVHDLTNVASHPNTKKPVGERMAASAMALVYGEKDYTADPPRAVSMRVEGDCVYVTFENVADGLAIMDGGEVLRGFTLGDSSGLFYAADAEIVSADTVAVRSASVTNPVAVTYAYELLTNPCNLGCKVDDKVIYAAAPCLLGELPERVVHTTIEQWADCDLEQIFHLTSRGGHFGIYYDAWTVHEGKVELSHNKTEKYQGNASLQMNVQAESFSVGPKLIGLTATKTDVAFYDVDTSYRRYNSISFMVKNATAGALTFEALLINGQRYAGDAVQIAAGGDWSKITLDFASIGLLNSSLANVEQIGFCFTAETAGNVYLDDVRLFKVN